MKGVNKQQLPGPNLALHQISLPFSEVYQAASGLLRENSCLLLPDSYFGDFISRL